MKSELQNKTISPKRAIIIYSNTRGHQTDYYLESSDITIKKGQWVFSAPVPLADDILQTIAAQYVKEKLHNVNHAQLIGAHILYTVNKAGRLEVIWYRPAQQKNLNFSGEISRKLKGIHKAWLPPTLYRLINGKLWVYALDSEDRPTEKTKLYRAPFFNIYSDGNVCLGSANVGHQSNTFEGEAQRYEYGFYAAEQNHGIGDQTKTPLEEIWSALIKNGDKFPMTELLPQRKYTTLGALLKSTNSDYDYENADTDPYGVLDAGDDLSEEEIEELENEITNS